MQPNGLSDPLDHVFIPFGLFGHKSHIECLPTHYNFQMQSECDNRTCKRQLLTLSQLLEEERHMHLVEVKKIEESLQEFASAKKKQCEQYRLVLQKMTSKVQKYKGKCCTLNEKIKQQLDTIKSLNNRITILENGLKSSRDECHQQKGITLEHVRLGSELRQIIALQQSQNKELSLRVRLSEQQIDSLQQELSTKIIHESKLKNVPFVSEEQYEREASLLRQNLKLQFSRSTDELFSTLPRPGFDFNRDHEEKETTISQSAEELRILSNFTQYGSSFLMVSSEQEITLPESKKIMAYFQSLLHKNQSLQEQVQSLSQIRDNLKQTMSSKLSEIQELVTVQQRPVYHASTQTPNSDTIEQLAVMNGFYRIKNIEFHQLLMMLTYFAGYLIQLSQYKQKKIKYFKRAANGKLKKVEKNMKIKFKAAAIAALFIQYAKKKASKAVRNDKRGSLPDNIENVMLKCLKKRESYNRKNPVIERLLREKAKVTREALISNFQGMVKEESIGVALSQGPSFNSSHYDINYF